MCCLTFSKSYVQCYYVIINVDSDNNNVYLTVVRLTELQVLTLKFHITLQHCAVLDFAVLLIWVLINVDTEALVVICHYLKPSSVSSCLSEVLKLMFVPFTLLMRLWKCRISRHFTGLFILFNNSHFPCYASLEGNVTTKQTLGVEQRYQVPFVKPYWFSVIIYERQREWIWLSLCCATRHPNSSVYRFTLVI